MPVKRSTQESGSKTATLLAVIALIFAMILGIVNVVISANLSLSNKRALHFYQRNHVYSCYLSAVVEDLDRASIAAIQTQYKDDRQFRPHIAASDRIFIKEFQKDLNLLNKDPNCKDLLNARK